MIVQNTVSVAANARNNNVLAGTKMERLDGDALIKVAVTGSAAGLECEFSVGTETAVERSAVSAANRIPQKEDTIAEEVEGLAGDLLQLAAINTTGGALTFNYRVETEDAD